MTVEVKLYHEKPINVLAIVEDLKKYGLYRETDYTFAYVPPCFSTEHGMMPRHTIFTFYKDYNATWFSLKYCI